jgi:hypothetical protein
MKPACVLPMLDLAYASGRAFKMVSVVFCAGRLILLAQTHTNHHTLQLDGKIKSSSYNIFLVLMTQSCCATSWLIVSCGGVGSRAPWRWWDDGGRHSRWVRSLASFHLGTLRVRCPPSIKSCQCRVFLIPT